MQQILITTISLYQLFFPIRGHCRFSPTCSEYAKIVIREHGVMRGSWLALVRLLNCQPFKTISNFQYQMSNEQDY